MTAFVDEHRGIELICAVLPIASSTYCESDGVRIPSNKVPPALDPRIRIHDVAEELGVVGNSQKPLVPLDRRRGVGVRRQSPEGLLTGGGVRSCFLTFWLLH